MGLGLSHKRLTTAFCEVYDFITFVVVSTVSLSKRRGLDEGCICIPPLLWRSRERWLLSSLYQIIQRLHILIIQPDKAIFTLPPEIFIKLRVMRTTHYHLYVMLLKKPPIYPPRTMTFLI
jgi:hypothetical protein